MTSSPEPADDGQIPPPENTPPSDPSSVPAEPTGGVDAPVSASVSPPEEEGLPEWEPLTPELVEDEAIRGDFVIRWAVVGLALLFGFSQIDETRTLVHVRTGEYLANHGFLPPAADVFSSTAGGRRWVNLPWLFDLLVAGVHGLGGGIGLSILQGILAGCAFGVLSHTFRPGIRTWWGSLCAVLALLACYSQLTVQPELITLVGLAGLLWIIVRAEEESCATTLWVSVPLIWVWSQFDQRAFLGWLLLISMGVGQALRGGEDAVARRQLWLRVAFISLAVVAIHPFLWESWLSPIRLFTTDYPSLRQIFARPFGTEVSFFPITRPAFWEKIDHDSIAALVLLSATIVSLVLNRERLNPGHLLAVILFNALGCLTTHELAAASLVNCVVCTVNAQTWYRHRFGQIYSIDWRELLFSRGGRAITVFCLFALAWTVISGRIDGPDGKRTGVGFNDHLLVQMDSYKQIAARSFDDHPFHFSARQGDLLIWVGQKSFIDTRAGLFSGSGEDNLIELHNRTRNAIRLARKTPDQVDGKSQQKSDDKSAIGNSSVWQETFSKYNITHVMPRLSGPMPPPDYITFFDLMSNTNDWVLTDLKAATAVFYRNGSAGELADFVVNNRLDIPKTAFNASASASLDSMPETLHECARPATTYDNLFSLRQPKHPAGIQEASHYLQIGAWSGTNLPMGTACALLSIRRATAGLRDDPNSTEGHRILGLAYLMMDRIETKVMKDAGINWFSASRYYQAVTSLQQAAILRPDDMAIQTDLLSLFERNRRMELALEALRQIKRLRPPLNTAELRKQWEPLINEEFTLVEKVGQIEDSVNQQLQNGADRYEVAAMANQAGAVRTAIRLLEEDAVYKEEKPVAKNALGAWLLEAGRIQDALETLDAVEQSSAMGGVPGWRDTVASGLLVTGDYSHAIRLWSDQIQEETTSSTSSVLLTFPFQAMNSMSDQFPLPHVGTISDIMVRVRSDIASLMYKIAMSQMEMGDNPAAKVTLSKMMENDPQSALLPLIRFHLTNLSDGKLDAEPKFEPPMIEEFESLGIEITEKKKSGSPGIETPDGGQKPK